MITKQIKKLLLLFISGTISVIIAACYGPPVDDWQYKKIKTKDKSNNLIPFLKLSLFKDTSLIDTFFTDIQGQREIMLLKEDVIDSRITIEDIDDTLNGGLFKKQEIELTNQDDYEIIMEK